MAFWIALGVCIVIALLVPLLVAASRGRWHGTHYDSNAWWTAFWGLVAFVVFMFVGGLGATQGYTNPRNYTHTSTTVLQALQSNDQVSGSFFLASGTVDEELTYRWLEKADDGIITREQIDADRAYIIEGGDRAVLERRFQCNTWVFPWGACMQAAYVFYVPEGSVLNEYEVTP